MTMSRKARGCSVVKQLNSLLGKFDKEDIIRNIIHTPQNNDAELFKKTKRVIIRHASIILREKYSNPDELLLFTYLQYIITKKQEETWNVLQIKNSKRFTKFNLLPEKISNSVLKYFNKYLTRCKVLIEKKGDCMWMVLIFEDLRPEPIYCVAHMELSLVFVCNVISDISLKFQKVLRKTFRGSDIVHLTDIQSNACKIQSLNIKSWSILYEKITCQDKSKTAFNNTEEDVDSGQSHDERPEEAESEEYFESRESMDVNDVEYNVLRENVRGPDIGQFTNIQNKADKIESLNAKSCSILNEKIACQDGRNATFNIMEEDVNPGGESLGETPEEAEFEECFENRGSMTNRYINYKVFRENFRGPEFGMFTDIQNNADQIESLNAKFHNILNEKIACQDGRNATFNIMEEDVDSGGESHVETPEETEYEDCFENRESMAIKDLNYQVKSYGLSKAVNDDFISNNIMKFQGSNILNGLDKLIECGIADDSLPDYLYQEPRSGKTDYADKQF